ncbi:Biofilm dispersion protein BdlA [Anoxybacillus sp. BCO1]|nr:Biofilm dispersion protein BdlA [Anoxybacillus sp. BCO1]
MKTHAIPFDIQHIFETLNNSFAMILFRPDTTVLWANDLFLQAMGYTEQQLLGLSHRQFCLPEYANSYEYTQFWNRLKNKQPFYGTVQRVTRHGKHIWLKAFYAPVLDEQGQVQAIFKIATDVTNIVDAHLEINEEFASLLEEMNASTSDIQQTARLINSHLKQLSEKAEKVKQKHRRNSRRHFVRKRHRDAIEFARIKRCYRSGSRWRTRSRLCDRRRRSAQNGGKKQTFRRRHFRTA